MAPLTPAINVICWCPGTAYSLEWSVGAQALPIPWNGQWVPRHCLFPGMVSDSGTAYSLEWSVAQALPIPWNGQWLKANEVQRGGGDCALAHWILLFTAMYYYIRHRAACQHCWCDQWHFPGSWEEARSLIGLEAWSRPLVPASRPPA